MAAPNYPAILQTLRGQLETAKTDLKNYKFLYQEEVARNREAAQRIEHLELQNLNLTRENKSLQNRLEAFQENSIAMQVPRGYKKYHQLKSPTAKARRRAQFKRCLNQSLMHLHEVKNVQVKLIIGDKDVNFSWCQNDLRNLRAMLVGQDVNNDNNDEHNEMEVDDNNQLLAGDEDLENNEQAEHPDPFLPDGKWNPQHIRRIIHVLDIFHISHDAYHELRLTSRSILPPLHRVKKEKKSMSTGIYYYKCGKVSFKSYL